MRNNRVPDFEKIWGLPTWSRYWTRLSCFKDCFLFFIALFWITASSTSLELGAWDWFTSMRDWNCGHGFTQSVWLQHGSCTEMSCSRDRKRKWWWQNQFIFAIFIVSPKFKLKKFRDFKNFWMLIRRIGRTEHEREHDDDHKIDDVHYSYIFRRSHLPKNCSRHFYPVRYSSHHSNNDYKSAESWALKIAKFNSWIQKIFDHKFMLKSNEKKCLFTMARILARRDNNGATLPSPILPSWRLRISGETSRRTREFPTRIDLLNLMLRLLRSHPLINSFCRFVLGIYSQCHTVNWIIKFTSTK